MHGEPSQLLPAHHDSLVSRSLRLTIVVRGGTDGPAPRGKQRWRQWRELGGLLWAARRRWRNRREEERERNVATFGEPGGVALLGPGGYVGGWGGYGNGAGSGLALVQARG